MTLDDSISVIAEENDYIVIDKPAGLIVHPPHAAYQEESLTQWLINKYPEIKEVGDQPVIRPGIVQRLDREVSGVMVVARKKSSYDQLKDQFKARKVQKEYTALVYGQIKRDDGEINLPLKKGKTRTLVMPMGSENERNKIKSASTYFEVLERFDHYTLVRIELKTGRTNQIRAHFLNFGHSVVGDNKYRHQRFLKRKAFTKFTKFDRVFLHAGRLGFNNQSGQWREYKADLPDELSKFLAKLA